MKLINKHGLTLLLVIGLLSLTCAGLLTESTSVESVSVVDSLGVANRQEQVINLYVTVVDSPQNNSLTFHDLNQWYESREIAETSPKLEIIVQEGGEGGPQKGDWGYGTERANATIQIRGATSKEADQKSYKIKLYEQAGLWQRQTVLNLNKHSYEFSRIRNKLSFDYFNLIPNLTSLQTQFVHLYVQDLSSGSATGDYEDYGLFTHIEQPNKRFLTSRSLDPYGQLYKATVFQFYLYPELKLASDPDFDQQAFEQILEIKGSNDHRKLLAMLAAVNDYNLSIDEIIDTYFERENYLTWLAVNLLMGNTDTTSQNYFLYSPVNSEKFFFLPWDYDEAWGANDGIIAIAKGYTAEWQRGISNYWGSVLHKRFIMEPDNIKQLTNKMEELLSIITREQTQHFLDSYYPIVSKIVKEAPDVHFLPDNVENYEAQYQLLAYIPQKYMDIYLRNLEKPMPVYLYGPEQTDDDYEFMWDASYDLQGDELTYDFQVSRVPDFSSIYLERKYLVNTAVTIEQDELIQGNNYWRVMIKDAKGYTQIAFDRLYGDDHYYNGIKEFYVD